MAEASPAVAVPQGSLRLVVYDFIRNPVKPRTLSTVAGCNEEGCKDGPALEALLLCPLGIAATRNGAVYFSENNSNLIKMLKNNQITTVAGCGAAGMQDGDALEAKFNAPWGLAMGHNGALYIADCENGRIRMLLNGQVSTVVEGLTGPRALAVGSDGALFIAEFTGHRIRMFKNGQLTRIAGSGVAGFSEGPALSARLVAPVAVAIGPDDKSLYILDWGNNCIRLLKDGELYRIAGDRKGGFADGPALFAKFNRPRGLVIGHDGTIYVSDSQNHCIRMLKDGFVTTIAGTGTKGSTDGPALSSQMTNPSFLDIGPDGLLYIASGDHKIRTLTITSRAARMRPRSIHLLSSINFGVDTEVKISDSTLKLHRCLAELRCPELLSNEGLKQQNVDQQAIRAFQHYIYSDELPDETSPRTLLGIAYLFQQAKLNDLAIECVAQLQAFAGSDKLSVEQILELYCCALDLHFADGQKVLIFLLRSCKKPPIKAALLRKALQGRSVDVFDALLDELLCATPIEEPFELLPTKVNGIVSLEQALQHLLFTKNGADFTITIQGEKPVKCHKFVLAARWPYFSKMANSGMRESAEMLLQLPATGSDCGMHPVVLQAILEVCYTGQITYETSMSFDPILALHLLATSALYLYADDGTENTFEPLLELAELRISSGLNVDNCIEVFRIAFEIGRSEAASKAKALIIANRMACLAPVRVSEVLALPAAALSSLLQDLRFL